VAPRGFLGLEWDEADKAVTIRRALPDSPAAAAGVRDGDVLLRVDGKPIESAKAARDALAEVRRGDSVELVVKREGAEKTFKVVAGEGL